MNFFLPKCCKCLPEVLLAMRSAAREAGTWMTRKTWMLPSHSTCCHGHWTWLTRLLSSFCQYVFLCLYISPGYCELFTKNTSYIIHLRYRSPIAATVGMMLSKRVSPLMTSKKSSLAGPTVQVSSYAQELLCCVWPLYHPWEGGQADTVELPFSNK